MRKIVLLGCGGWGKNIARNLAQLGALDCIVDPSPFGADIARDLGVEWSSSIESALCRPNCEAVAIATPAATHFAMAMAAIQAGKHVFIEKPIALSADEGREIASAAAQASLTVMVGHLLQYHPCYRALKNLIAEGRLGSIRHIASSRLSLGLLRNEENVMWSFAPHDISMALGLSPSAPETVMAIGSDFLQPNVVDVCTLLIGFRNGLTAEIRSSWLHPEKEQKLIVVGDRAMAIFNDVAVWDEKLEIVDFEINWDGPRPRAKRNESQFVSVPKGEPLALELQHFIDCVDSGKPPQTDSAEAIRVLAVLEAGQKSLDSGGIRQDV